MQAALFVRLVLPLVAVAALAIVAHDQAPADGLFLDVAIAAMSTLITVAYVDWIVRHHDEVRWPGTDQSMSTRLQSLASSTVTGIRVAFGFSAEVFDQPLMETTRPEAIRGEVMRVALHIVVPATEERIGRLDAAGWTRLCHHLEAMSLECGVLLDRFGPRLRPLVVQGLLDLQQSLDAAQAYWRTLPDIAGVPLDQLPRTRGSTRELQLAWNQMAAQDVRQALQRAATLSDLVRDNA